MHTIFCKIYGGGKQIAKRKPAMHYDVGSRIDGFVAHLLVMEINVTVIDIRPLPFEVEGLTFIRGDATNLEVIKDCSIESLSSLHAIEHFGLGRYGDAIDIHGWEKALDAYKRILIPGGFLYLSVPVGTQDVLCYNAHRIFKPTTIIRKLKELELVSFDYIRDMKIYHVENIKDISLEEDYLCGLFIFRKPDICKL